jgi:non-ribosomal peptide synthetase component F
MADRERTLSYAELDALAGQVAARLTLFGVAPGDVVAVGLPRRAAALATLLAIWRVGAVYLPVDLDQPAARLAGQLAVAGARTLVVSADRQDVPANYPVLFLRTDAPAGPVPAGPVPAGGHGEVDPAATAYILPTSGSTGSPKAVAVPHQALANCLSHFADALAVGPEDRVLALTTFTFDISLLELLLPMQRGGVSCWPTAACNGTRAGWSRGWRAAA